MKSDPIRLLEDSQMPVQLRDDLRTASENAPIAYDANAGLVRLMATLAAGGGGAPGDGSADPGTPSGGTAGPSPSAAGAGGSGAMSAGGSGAIAQGIAAGKMGILGAVAVGAVGIAVAIGLTSETTPPAVSSAPTATSMGIAASPLGAEPLAAAPASPRAAEAPMAGASTHASPQPTPEIGRSASPPTSQETPSSGEASRGAPPRPSVKEETEQLARVRELAQSNPGGALALVEAGHARFPRGVFWQEREAIAIFSLVKLGRSAEAKTRARAFLARHPESPFAESLRAAVGSDP